MADFFIVTKALKSIYSNSQRIVDDQSSMLQLININGLFVHLCFIALFILIDIKELVALNIVSIILWTVSIYYTLKSHYRISVFLISIEVSVHAIVATLTMGLASGFQLYLWPAVLLMCILPTKNPKDSFICLAVIIAPLLLLNLFAPRERDVYQSVYTGLYFFNLLMASVPYILTALIMRMIYMHNFENMAHRAYNDELTQLINRRRGYELLHDAAAQSQSLCLALGDIDHFKHINDSLGHLKGDEALQKVAYYCTQQLDGLGTCCRWGGEEFLFIFIDQPYQHVQYAMEELCQKMPSKVVMDGLDSPITCSFGLICVNSEETIEQALTKVDKLMYQAKNEGRFRVCHPLVERA